MAKKRMKNLFRTIGRLFSSKSADANLSKRNDLLSQNIVPMVYNPMSTTLQNEGFQGAEKKNDLQQAGGGNFVGWVPVNFADPRVSALMNATSDLFNQNQLPTNNHVYDSPYDLQNNLIVNNLAYEGELGGYNHATSKNMNPYDYDVESLVDSSDEITDPRLISTSTTRNDATGAVLKKKKEATRINTPGKGQSKQSHTNDSGAPKPR